MLHHAYCASPQRRLSSICREHLTMSDVRFLDVCRTFLLVPDASECQAQFHLGTCFLRGSGVGCTAEGLRAREFLAVPQF